MDLETPRYRVMIDLTPAPRARYRQERPFTDQSDVHCWQYAERPYKAGEIIESKAWPHLTMVPLNEAARLVHGFFKSAMKSRLSVSPYQSGRLVLNDGLSGPAQPIVTTVRPAFPNHPRYEPAA
jgi:hypothetical protein